MSHSQTNSQAIIPIKNYLSSFAVLLFALLLAIIQTGATSDITAQGWLNTYFVSFFLMV
jgi:hypothetical protein